MFAVSLDRRMILCVLAPLALYMGWNSLEFMGLSSQKPSRIDEQVGSVGTRQLGTVETVTRSAVWVNMKKTLENLRPARTNFEEESLNWVQSWAKGKGDDVKFDAITIGSSETLEEMRKQRLSWGFKARGWDFASEMTADTHIISDGGSCPELTDTCGKVYQSDEDICYQRRIGLAMSAYVSKNRNIAVNVYMAKNTTWVAGDEIDKSTDEWKESRQDALPGYLILTFDSTNYKTKHLEECLGQDVDSKPIVYAPHTSLTDVNLQDQYDEKPSDSSSITSFPYPSKATGVVFNKAALEIWTRNILCNKSDKIAYYLRPQLDYDPKTHPVEHSFCTWNAMETPGKSQSKPDSVFSHVIRKVLKIEAINRLEVISINDILALYAKHMHLLCQEDDLSTVPENLKFARIPSVEEMIGYLVNQFKLSGDDGLMAGDSEGVKQVCKDVVIGEGCTMLSC